MKPSSSPTLHRLCAAAGILTPRLKPQGCPWHLPHPISQCTSVVFLLSIHSAFSTSSRTPRCSWDQLGPTEIQPGLDQQKYNQGYKCTFKFVGRHIKKKPPIFFLKTNISRSVFIVKLVISIKWLMRYFTFSPDQVFEICALYLYSTSQLSPAPLYVLNSHALDFT